MLKFRTDTSLVDNKEIAYTYVVDKDGAGDFESIQAAVDAAREGDYIFIKPGVYRERVEVRTNNLTIVGASKDRTIIDERYYAKKIMDDGIKRGTFRTYTVLINADNVTVMNLTISNSAGYGKEVGQAIALYAEGRDLIFKKVRLIGCQDTLFTGPLPFKENEKGGFRGPTEHAPREEMKQYYEECYIEGEVDFIFGSACAYFRNCVLYALERNEKKNAFYTAPSTYEFMKVGYVFDHCTFTGNASKGSCYISRPWRIYAKTVLLDCVLSDCINEQGYDDWDKLESHESCYYAEYNSSGAGANKDKRLDYVKFLSAEEADAFRISLDN